MREGCRSHYPASWHSQGKEAEKRQEEQPCSLRLGRSTEQEGTAVLIFNLVAISKFLLSCFSQMGRIAVLLCFMMECVLYPDFYTVIACRNKNGTKLSPLSLLSSPPPTPVVVPVQLYVHRYAHALCKGSQLFYLVALILPKPSWQLVLQHSSWVVGRYQKEIESVPKSCFVQGQLMDT